MNEQRWAVRVTAPVISLTDDELIDAAHFGATIRFDSAVGLLTAAYEVDAPTLRQATHEALRTARKLPAKPTRLEVLPLDDWLAEQKAPRAMDLLGTSEVAEVLGVARQRVGQLLDTRADFPAPIARPSAGPVWTRSSVEAFLEGWSRKITGRPRKVKD